MKKRIIQLSDMHLPSKGEFLTPLCGKIDPHASFLKTLEASNPMPQDLLLLSGDIAATQADPEIYSWLAQHLDNIKCKKIIIAGNHDDSKMMRDYFEYDGLIGNSELFGSFIWEGIRFIYLDSSTNYITDEQLLWLKECPSSPLPTIIIIHHPPIKCKSDWMDKKYPLKNRTTVWECLQKIENLQAILCGHYHSDFKTKQSGVNIFIAPSTAYQIEDDLTAEIGRRDLPTPGYLEILISKQGISRPRVNYLS